MLHNVIIIIILFFLQTVELMQLLLKQTDFLKVIQFLYSNCHSDNMTHNSKIDKSELLLVVKYF